VNESGQEVARGLASYSSLDVARLAGQRTNAIERVLGYSNGDEVIHRDDLVLLREMRSE
jgi:glutamate 5-kinase